MLVDKVKRDDSKGYSCKYDKPETPCQRVLDEHVLTPEAEASLTAYRARLHPIELRHRLEKRLRRIIRRQEEYTLSKRSHGPSTTRSQTACAGSSSATADGAASIASGRSTATCRWSSSFCPDDGM